MSIVILHSRYDADSRALIASMGVVPASGDETFDVGGLSVRVVSDHEQAVRVFPGFGRYPTVVYRPNDDKTYTLQGPTSWQQCLDFMVDPWGVQGTPAGREMTRLEFLNRFTEAEQVLLKSLEATDTTVALFWEQYRAAPAIRADDPRTLRALDYLTAQGHLAAGRKEEILAG